MVLLQLSDRTRQVADVVHQPLKDLELDGGRPFGIGHEQAAGRCGYHGPAIGVFPVIDRRDKPDEANALVGDNRRAVAGGTIRIVEAGQLHKRAQQHLPVEQAHRPGMLDGHVGPVHLNAFLLDRMQQAEILAPIVAEGCGHDVASLKRVGH